MEIKKSDAYLPDDNSISCSGTKDLHWHTTFGEIRVIEQVYKRPGKRFRPFSQTAGITCRCCSIPLQRIVTDFGADHAFCQVPPKLEEPSNTAETKDTLSFPYSSRRPLFTCLLVTSESQQQCKTGNLRPVSEEYLVRVLRPSERIYL